MRNKIRIMLYLGCDGLDIKVLMIILLGFNVGGGKGVDMEYVILIVFLIILLNFLVRWNVRIMMMKRLFYI